MSATMVDHAPTVSNQAEKAESDARGASCCEEATGAEFKSMEMCPMSGMCMGMMKEGSWSWLLPMPGLLLVAGGLLVILVPSALAWLVGGTAILMGVMFFFMATRMRKFAMGSSAHTTETQSDPTTVNEGGGTCLSFWSR